MIVYLWQPTSSWKRQTTRQKNGTRMLITAMSAPLGVERVPRFSWVSNTGVPGAAAATFSRQNFTTNAATNINTNVAAQKKAKEEETSGTVRNSKPTPGRLGAFTLPLRVPYQFRLAAASLVEIWEHMEGWGIDDIAIGLAALWRVRVRQKRNSGKQQQHASIINEAELDNQRQSLWRLEEETNVDMVKLARRLLVISHATYQSSQEQVFKYLAEKNVIPDEKASDLELSKSNFASRADETRPSYMLSLCHKSKSIVLSVRGTWSVDDVLLNVMAAPCEFRGGLVHRGMLRAAEAMIAELADEIDCLREQYPDYKLITTGHSMGAGIAAIAAITLHPYHRDVRCFGFCPPACLSLDLAIRSEPFIYSFVHGNDVTPRFHVAAMEQLREELHRIDWSKEILSLAKESWEDIAQYVSHSAFIRSTLQRGYALNSSILKWIELSKAREVLVQQLQILEKNVNILSRIRTRNGQQRQSAAELPRDMNVEETKEVQTQLKYIKDVLEFSERLLLKLNGALGQQLPHTSSNSQKVDGSKQVLDAELASTLAHFTSKLLADVVQLWENAVSKTRSVTRKLTNSSVLDNKEDINKVDESVHDIEKSVVSVEETLDHLEKDLKQHDTPSGSENTNVDSEGSHSIAERTKILTQKGIQPLASMWSQLTRRSVRKNDESAEDASNESKCNPVTSPKVLMQYYCAGSLYHMVYQTTKNEETHVKLLQVLPHPDIVDQQATTSEGHMPPTHHKYLGTVIFAETMFEDHLAGRFEDHFDVLLKSLEEEDR